jgi:ribonuclease HI
MRSALSIMTLTTNYQRALKKNSKRADGWKTPPEGTLLLNIDGGYKPERGDGGGGIIRDSPGTFIAASYCYLDHVVDAPIAEVHTLREGLLLAQYIGCQRLTIQSDCLEVETMKQGGFSAAGAPIYDECVVLWQDFKSISIDHCNRDINRAAHNLASLAIQSKNSRIWIDETPSFIIEALVNDVTLFSNQKCARWLPSKKREK